MTAEQGPTPEGTSGIVKMGPQGWEHMKKGSRMSEAEGAEVVQRIGDMRSIEQAAVDVEPETNLEPRISRTGESRQPNLPGTVIVDLTKDKDLPPITW